MNLIIWYVGESLCLLNQKYLHNKITKDQPQNQNFAHKYAFDFMFMYFVWYKHIQNTSKYKTRFASHENIKKKWEIQITF